MRYGVILLMLGLVCSVGALQAAPSPGALVLSSLAVCWFGVALGYLRLGPRVFMKRPDGTLPTISWLLFWPYFLLNHLLLAVTAALGRENAIDEVASNLFLGRRLTVRDRRVVAARPFSAVLDLTGEFAESGLLRRVGHYRCIPLLDTAAPTQRQLTEGVAFIQAAVGGGAVLVHCALGHGRSATFVAAYLVAEGKVSDEEAAVTALQPLRPGVKVSSCQRRALAAFARNRLKEGACVLPPETIGPN